jgi:hypothetical protein
LHVLILALFDLLGSFSSGFDLFLKVLLRFLIDWLNGVLRFGGFRSAGAFLCLGTGALSLRYTCYIVDLIDCGFGRCRLHVIFFGCAIEVCG